MPPFFSDTDPKMEDHETSLLGNRVHDLGSKTGLDVQTDVNDEPLQGIPSSPIYSVNEVMKDIVTSGQNAHDVAGSYSEITAINKDSREKSVSNESILGEQSNDLSSTEKKTQAKARVAKILKKLMVDESEDSGSESEVERQAATMTRRPAVETRLPKSERRMYQNMLYTALVEDRLHSLESAVKKLQNKDDESVDYEDEHRTRTSSHAVAIKYLKWAEFQKKPNKNDSMRPYVHGDPGDSTPGSVLEVLTEEPQIHNRSRFRGRKREDSSMDGGFESDPSFKSTATNTAESHNHQRPIRVRIRSPLLVKILGRFAAKPLGNHDRSTVTISSPFKLLIVKANPIRELLQRLEVIHSATSVEPDPSKHKMTDEKSASESADETTKNKTTQLLDNNLGLSGQESTIEDTENIDDTESYEALEHLRILVKFIDEDLQFIWKLREDLKQGSLRKIAFVDLWHLFDYGQEVRSPKGKDLQIYRVLFFTGGREVLDFEVRPRDNAPVRRIPDYSQRAFLVQVYHLDFNGNQYAARDSIFMIRRYEGEIDIDTLACYPLACDPNRQEIKQKMLERGEEFARLTARNNALHRHKNYVGLTVDKQQEQVDSQVIVDFQWAFLRNPDLKPELGFTQTLEHDGREVNLPDSDLGTCGKEGCCGNDWIHWDFDIDNDLQNEYQSENKHLWEPVDNAEDFDDDEKVLFPYMAFGFVLRSRKWASFAIERLNNVMYNDGWSNLELPKGHKETVLALVQNHAGSPTQGKNGIDTFATMDLVRGKGKGLIILLHGEPGVGKTSTAECVADHTRRPLFPITCGDIGDSAEKVEDNLENNFQLAHRWGCVLLLDEADVFLQKRSKQDLARNSIVSVFLRTLEYYSGILFLTTNRVGAIDQAFKSRIHLSLLYPRLDRHSTVTIWKNHLNRIQKQVKAEKKKLDIDKKDIISYARTHYRELEELRVAPWNGRQIRNAFQTAMALAEYEAGASTPKLNRDQFRKVADMSKHFDHYLKEVWGGKNDADISKIDQVRMDTLSTEDLRHITTPKPKERAQPIPGLKRVPTATILAPKKQQSREESESEHSSDEDDFPSEEEESGSESENGEEEEEAPQRLLSPPPEPETVAGRSRRKSKMVRERREESPVSKKSARSTRY